MNGSPEVVVVGPVTRDLTLAVPELPPAGGSAVADETVAAAGGKGANPAVAAARLGARVRLVGVVGDDATGATVLAQLRGDGIDVSAVKRCADAPTGEIVHLVEPGGRRRYVENPGANARLALSAQDVACACSRETVALISTAVPSAAAQAAVAGARRAGARVFVDLAGEPSTSETVLSGAELVRGDADEVHALTGTPVVDFATAAAAARELIARGPRIAVVQAADAGDLLLGPDGEVRLARLEVATVDPTGAGDALIATLAVTLGRGYELERAGRLASAAAAHTAAHLGGRPRFTDESELAAALAS